MVTVLPPGVIIMANASTWCLPTNQVMSKKSGVLDFTIGMIKKVIHFNGKSPSFCNIM